MFARGLSIEWRFDARLLVLASVGLASCAVGTGPTAEPRGDAAHTLELARGPAEARPAPAGQAHRGTTVAEAPSPVDEAAGPKLTLPSDVNFLERPLPAADPQRYASFRERSRIHVGQSHLQELDVLETAKLLIASSSNEASVRIYDQRSGRLLSKAPIPGAERFETGELAAWPSTIDGQAAFVTASPSGLSLFSAPSAELLRVLDTRPVRSLRWSPDGQVLVTAQANIEKQTSELHFHGRVGATLKPLGSLAFVERVDGFDLSRDNRLLALSHYPSGDVRVLDLATSAEVLRVPGPRYAGDVSFSPDGRYVAVGGEGLLVVDLLVPARRAFYSQLGNNIGQVRFSPSGDAIVASAFDGKVRIFELRQVSPAEPAPSSGADTSGVGGRTALHLVLLKTLHHAANANVYDFAFDEGGYGLTSASGDQTLRWFRGQPSHSQTPQSQSPKYFTPLARLREQIPQAAGAWSSPPEPEMSSGHYVPRELSGAARPSRLQSGTYACKISTLYKLRDCFVTRNATGHTLLTFSPDNLLPLQAVVYDDGPNMRFSGWLTEPSTVVGCEGCERQPLHGLLRGSATNLEGILTFRNYYDPFSEPEPPAADVKIEEANDRFPIVLKFRKAESTPTVSSSAGSTPNGNSVRSKR